MAIDPKWEPGKRQRSKSAVSKIKDDSERLRRSRERERQIIEQRKREMKRRGQ
jgi:hypothetical protein